MHIQLEFQKTIKANRVDALKYAHSYEKLKEFEFQCLPVTLPLALINALLLPPSTDSDNWLENNKKDYPGSRYNSKYTNVSKVNSFF